MDARSASKQRLDETLRYVVEKVPFYRSLGLDPNDPGGLHLSYFPVIEASMIADRIEDFCVLDRFPDFVLTTGGTSSGLSGIVFRNRDEFGAATRERSDEGLDEALDPAQFEAFAIQLIDSESGFVMAGQLGLPRLRLPLAHLGHPEIIRRFLERGIVVGGRCLHANILLGGLSRLKMLTSYLVGIGCDPKVFGIEAIFGYGGHPTQVWRTRLEETWNAKFRSMYGLTEMNVEVVPECVSCGGFHFGDAIHAEFLSPVSRSSVDVGEGVLVLSTLAPPVYTTPRIRYWTGDVVRLMPFCPRARAQAFDFRGRLQHSLCVEEEGECRTVVTIIDLWEVVEGIADIATHESYVRNFYDLAVDRPTVPFPPGQPMCHVAASPPGTEPLTFDVTVEANFDPDGEPARARRLRDEVVERLHEVVPTLALDVEELGVRIAVEVVPRGGLMRRKLCPPKV